MDCDVAREALSARIDGERGPVPSARVEEHLRCCPRCRAWYDHARRFTVDLRHLAGADRPRPAPAEPRRPRAVPPEPAGDPDTAERPVPARPGRDWLCWALAATGVLQLGLVAAQLAGIDFGLVGGAHDAGSGVHLLHESTAWSAAAGAVTVAAALWARLIPGLACVLAVYVAVLGYVVAADHLAGQVTAARMLSHLPVLAAAVLAGMVWRRAAGTRPSPGPRAAIGAGAARRNRRTDPWPRGDSAA